MSSITQTKTNPFHFLYAIAVTISGIQGNGVHSQELGGGGNQQNDQNDGRGKEEIDGTEGNGQFIKVHFIC
jgi:hypothetical protein